MRRYKEHPLSWSRMNRLRKVTDWFRPVEVQPLRQRRSAP